MPVSWEESAWTMTKMNKNDATDAVEKKEKKKGRKNAQNKWWYTYQINKLMPTIFILLYHSHLSLVCDALYSLFVAVAARSAAAARALKNFLKKKKNKLLLNLEQYGIVVKIVYLKINPTLKQYENQKTLVFNEKTHIYGKFTQNKNIYFYVSFPLSIRSTIEM